MVSLVAVNSYSPWLECVLDAVNLVAGEEPDGDGVVDVEVDTAVVVGQYASGLQ